MKTIKIVSQCPASGKAIVEVECQMCGCITTIYREIKDYEKNMPEEKCPTCGLTNKDIDILMQSPIPAAQSKSLKTIYKEMEYLSTTPLSPPAKKAFITTIESLNKLNTILNIKE